MDENIKVLKEIYTGCEAGSIAITDIMDKIEDNNLKMVINEIKGDYQDLSEIVLKELKKFDETGDNFNPTEKLVMFASSNLSTLLDRSNKNIASLMIKGDKMGLDSINEYKDKKLDKSTKKIMSNYVVLLKNHIEKMNKYL